MMTDKEIIEIIMLFDEQIEFLLKEARTIKTKREEYKNLLREKYDNVEVAEFLLKEEVKNNKKVK